MKVAFFGGLAIPHMKSMLSEILGSKVHHRRAERGVSITLPSLRQSNFGKLQFGFVLAFLSFFPEELLPCSLFCSIHRAQTCKLLEDLSIEIMSRDSLFTFI